MCIWKKHTESQTKKSGSRSLFIVVKINGYRWVKYIVYLNSINFIKNRAGSSLMIEYYIISIKQIFPTMLQ